MVGEKEVKKPSFFLLSADLLFSGHVHWRHVVNAPYLLSAVCMSFLLGWSDLWMNLVSLIIELRV